MKQEVKKLLKSWESSLERYSKLDSWKIEKDLAILGEYLRGKEDSKSIRELIRQIRDKAICPSFESTSMVTLIKRVFEKMDTPKEDPPDRS